MKHIKRSPRDIANKVRQEKKIVDEILEMLKKRQVVMPRNDTGNLH